MQQASLRFRSHAAPDGSDAEFPNRAARVLHLGGALVRAGSLPVAHFLRALTLALGSLITACLPYPSEPVETDSLPPGRCWASSEKVASGRWQLGVELAGGSATSRAGELAPARLEVTLSEWPSEHLLDLRLELTVVAGQALPGQVLQLRHGGELLQEATLEGAHGNQAQFDVRVPRDVCGTPCAFSLILSSAPADSDVPVPLKLRGTLQVFVDAARETRPCAEQPLRVELGDAF